MSLCLNDFIFYIFIVAFSALLDHQPNHHLQAPFFSISYKSWNLSTPYVHLKRFSSKIRYTIWKGIDLRLRLNWACLLYWNRINVKGGMVLLGVIPNSYFKKSLGSNIKLSFSYWYISCLPFYWLSVNFSIIFTFLPWTWIGFAFVQQQPRWGQWCHKGVLGMGWGCMRHIGWSWYSKLVLGRRTCQGGMG